MPALSDLVAAVETLLGDYRVLASRKPLDEELPSVAFAIERALASLEARGVELALASAAAELAAARATLARIREGLSH